MSTKLRFLVAIVSATVCLAGRGMDEHEARSFLQANRSLMVSIANGEALKDILLEKMSAGDGERAAIFGDALSFLKGREIVFRGSMVGVSRRFWLKGSKAVVTIGYLHQQPVNVKCHLLDAASSSFVKIGTGQPVVVRGRLDSNWDLLAELTFEDSSVVPLLEFEKAKAAMRIVSDELLGDVLVLPGPFSSLPGGDRRELLEMARCAAASYPAAAIPSWYRPMSRAEWTAATADIGYADDVYADDGYFILGNGLRGRLMVHRLTGRTVIAWSGCDLVGNNVRMNGGVDVLTCVKHLLTGNEKDQYRQARAVCEGVLKARTGDVWVVGHSLGGSLATYVALLIGEDGARLACASFNGLGVCEQLCGKLDPAARTRAVKRMRNVYCAKDPVYNGNRLLSWVGVAPVHVGRSYYLEYGQDAFSSEGVDGLMQCHGLGELERQMALQCPALLSETKGWGSCLAAGLLAVGLAVGLIVLFRRRHSSTDGTQSK